MSYVKNSEEVLLVDVHSEPSLEYGFSSHECIDSKYGEVWMSIEDISFLHIIFPMCSSTITSRVPSTSYEYGEAFSITMAHLGLLFHILAADYNLHSNLMLQDPYESPRFTYSESIYSLFQVWHPVWFKFLTSNPFWFELLTWWFEVQI